MDISVYRGFEWKEAISITKCNEDIPSGGDCAPMTTRSEIQTLASYVLSDKNRVLVDGSGFEALPQERREATLRGLQDLGWIGHTGVADLGESYTLTREGRRISTERPGFSSLDPKVREQIESLRFADSDINGDRRDGLERLIKTECDHGCWDSAMVNCYELKRLADKSKDAARQAFALFHLGKVEIAQNKWDEALESQLGALEKYMEVGDRRGVAETNRSIGVIYGNKGDHQSAKRCFENSLESAMAIGDRELQAKALGNLAIVLDMEGRFDEAEEAHKDCLKCFMEIGDIQSVARTSNNLGVMFLTSESYREAVGYFETAIDSCRKTKNKGVLGVALVNAGHCYAKLGDLSKAIARTDEAISIVREPNDLNLLAHAFRNYGLIEFRSANIDKACEWFEKSIRTAMGSGVKNTLATCYYDYGMSLIEATVELRLAKKMLKKASSLFRDLGNLDRVTSVERRLATA